MNRENTKFLIIHCSATPPQSDPTIADIDRWHKERGIESPLGSLSGYHMFIRRDGTIEHGRQPMEIGAHAHGANDNSLGVCLSGGVDKELRPEANYTLNQWQSLSNIIESAKQIYPGISVIGHNQVSNKACPSFDVPQMLKLFQIEV